MPHERKTQTQVLQELETSHTNIVVEAEKDWLWVVEPDLAPLHKVKGGCTCDECKSRAAKRETLKLIGFRFSFKDHNLPSGKVSRWAHSCTRPTRFSKKPKNGASASEAPHRQTEDDLAEAEAFFNQ